MYKYSISIILRTGFIDTKNSFINKDRVDFENFKKLILDENIDKNLANILLEFEQSEKEKNGIWLDCNEYILPTEIEKMYITKIKTCLNFENKSDILNL
jgi:hypothetical protein